MCYTHKYRESDKDLLASDMLDDVKDLLDGDFGDDRILKDVYRACQNGEVISNYERKYVRDLTERYLKGRRMGMDSATYNSSNNGAAAVRHDVSTGDQQGDYDVDLYGMPDVAAGSKRFGMLTGRKRKKQSDDGSVRLLSSKAKKATGSRGKIVAMSVGIVLVAAIAAGALVVTTTTTTSIPPTDPPSPSPSPPSTVQFHVKTDLLRYSMGDFVSISGWTGTEAGGMVNLSITNSQGATVWTESVVVRSGGDYSTLVIVGGDAGWNVGGTFAVTAMVSGDFVTADFEVVP